VTLDGSTSTSTGGTPTYAWRLVSTPRGAIDQIQGTGARVKLLVRQAGDYVVELTVKDTLGCQSQPVQVKLRVVPIGEIHGELTWAESYGDVDLHYIGPGGRFYQRNPAGDLDWEHSLATAVGQGTPRPTRNRNPDWGLNDTVSGDGLPDNDPSLD